MFKAYHGVTGATHQSHFDTLSAKGYRMISLSVYGVSSHPCYAAVWVKRKGPAWVAIHGVDGAGYQAFFDKWAAKGYALSLVSATGTSSNPVFAAVFEKGITNSWFARHGMTSGPKENAGTFQNMNAMARDKRMILRSVAVYGTAGDPRYAAVWHANPEFVKWHVHASDTGANYQVSFDAETQLPGYRLAGYRPAYVALSGDKIYCSVFKDDVVGSWRARHGMTSDAYQKEFDKMEAAGFYPICVQGGGSGGSTRYAAIFAKQDVPLNRQWTATGTTAPSLTAFDDVMKSFMTAHGVRAAQLAIAKNGVTKLSRGYTWAEADYRVTQPSDRFLLASCSKMFLAAAVQSLYDVGTLKPTTKVYPFLGFSKPVDPLSDSITVQQLLEHTGGYDNTSTGSNFDPTYNMRTIAKELKLSKPVTKLDIARYMYQKPLDFDPGERRQYSNFGYLLAGAVVEKVTGMKYFDYVRTQLLQPAGISEVLVFPTLASDRTANMAIVEDEGWGPSPIDLTSELVVPAVYGGDGEINEVGDPNAGLGASAHALTQFIHRHAVLGNGPRTPGPRSGSTPGSSSLAVSRDDGVDWAYVVNTRDWAPATSPSLDDMGSAITDLLKTTPIT